LARARLERTIRFRAHHHYRLPDRSEFENRALFGDLVEPHPHTWAVTFVAEGEMADVTGFSVDLRALEELVFRLTKGWDGADLNEVIPEVRSGTMLPSCEALAQWLHESASGQMPEGAVLVRVRVAESEDIAATYPPPSEPGRPSDDR